MFRKLYFAVGLVCGLSGLGSESFPKAGIILICTEGKMRTVKAQEGILGVITEVKTWPKNAKDSRPCLCLGVPGKSLNAPVQALALSGVKPLKPIKMKCIWTEEKLFKL